MKRHKSLQPLSREHHQGLLLCWKIRTGFSKGVAAKRIKNYADWFFNRYLVPHFDAEEQYIFPILGNEHELTVKALEEHGRLKMLFNDTNDLTTSLKKIEEELEAHIRYEERVLFQKIQEIATEEELRRIEDLHDESSFEENTKDVFWK